MTVTWRKCCWNFLDLDKAIFFSLFTEIIKIIYLKCSEAFFFQADSCLASGKDEPLQWHCQWTEVLGSSAAGEPWGGGGQLAECEPVVGPGSKGSQQLLSCAIRGMAWRSGEGIIPLCVALVRPQLDTGGAGHPEWLCNLHPWMVSSPNWSKPWATCSDSNMGSALGRRVHWRPPEVLPSLI